MFGCLAVYGQDETVILDHTGDTISAASWQEYPLLPTHFLSNCRKTDLNHFYSAGTGLPCHNLGDLYETSRPLFSDLCHA